MDNYMQLAQIWEMKNIYDPLADEDKEEEEEEDE